LWRTKNAWDLYCQDWYSLGKTLAEQEALEYARNNGLNVVTLCPPFVFGPLLQSSVNASSKLLIYVIKGCIISVTITSIPCPLLPGL
jgi:nucleoside-diphosphate-sugar epimerase